MARRHMRIAKTPEETYLITDLYACNGITYGDQKTKIKPGETVVLRAGTIICAGGVELKLL